MRMTIAHGGRAVYNQLMTKKWVLITGASSGIGAELAKICAMHRLNIVLVARTEKALRTLATELKQTSKVEVIVIPADLSDFASVKRVVTQLTRRGITIDYLVNNAGFGDFGRFVETSWDKEVQMLDLNIKALTYLTKIYAAEMVGRGVGRIVNVASGAAFQPGPMMAVYFATKAYVLHLSEAIAEELVGTGVTVTALCPGPTESNFWATANKQGGLAFMGRHMPSSAAVAAYGYQAMMRGDRVAIYGFTNRLGAFLVRLAPRRLVTWALMQGQLRS